MILINANIFDILIEKRKKDLSKLVHIPDSIHYLEDVFKICFY